MRKIIQYGQKKDDHSYRGFFSKEARDAPKVKEDLAISLDVDV